MAETIQGTIPSSIAEFNEILAKKKGPKVSIQQERSESLPRTTGTVLA